MSFVIGFHRSGTSLLTSVLQSICGCSDELPFTLMPSAEDNPKGFYESLELFNLNNQLLEAVGHRWDSPWLAAPRFEDCVSGVDSHTLERFLQTHPLSKDSNWIDKDPRLCLTIDMISRISNTALPSIGIIRNPLATTHSLRKRNGFSMDHALGLWIIYNYHAFVANSSLPIALITFEGLLSGREDVASQIGGYLKAHRSRSRDIEVQEKQDELQEIMRHLKERTQANLVHRQEKSAQGNNNLLRDAAMEMWRALTCDPSGTYYPTSEIKSKASEALSLTLSQYNLIVPSTYHTCYIELTKSWKSSLEECRVLSQKNEGLSANLESSARSRNQAISELEQKHASAISELGERMQHKADNLEEEIQLARSERAYWHAQYNETTIVIRDLQTEILEFILKRELLIQKLDWLRRSLATAHELLAGSTKKTRTLQMRVSQIISSDS